MASPKHLPTLIGLLVVLLVACVPERASVHVPEQRLPETFMGGKDSLDPSTLDRRAFFDDPLLLALIDTALARNHDLLMAGQRIEVARAGVRGATGRLLPQVNAQATGSMRKFGLYTMDGAGNIVTEITPGQLVPIDLPDLYLGVQATWEVDLWGRLRNMRRSAAHRFLATSEARQLMATQLVAEVAVTYYELTALDRELDILQRTVLQQQKALEVIVEQKQAGRASELGVQQFTAQVARTRALERSTRQRITEAENRMNFLIGSFPRPVQRSTTALDTARANRTIAAVPGQLLQYRPDIRQAEQELLAARADVRAARAAFYPGLIVAGGYGVQAFDPELLFTTPQSIAYTALGGLVAPLVNRNEIRARFNAADAEQVNALLAYQRTVLHAFMEVHNGLARIENLRAAARERSGETEALRGAAATASELYRSAKASYIDVLLAQQGALAAEIELVETLKQLRVAHVDIYRAIGGGWR